MRTKPTPYQFYDDPLRFYNAIFSDILRAKEYIYLETYRVGYDEIGIRLRDLLVRKAQEGIKIKLLIDSWGGNALPGYFFDTFKKFGGEVRFFTKIKINSDFFTRSHRRNHRKLLIIDNDISYIGSSNFTAYNMNWRESVLRISGGIANTFKEIFNQNFTLYNKYVFELPKYTKTIYSEGFEIIRDVPSIAIQKIKKKYIEIIKEAKRKIIIETPYFLPGFLLRKALTDAAKRGVEVNIILPRHSDVGVIDILRNKYLGPLHSSGVKILFYQEHNLHAKLILIDDSLFSIGSSNFDFRSFRYMHEIVILGKNRAVTKQLIKHFQFSINNSIPFDYFKWQSRSWINRFFEWLLLPLRHLL
ncbi:MAG: phosphatidylserine/phosphatidylglycerophosphate/cardiolipin synthase family protein [Hyphomicrobiales bacterium]